MCYCIIIIYYTIIITIIILLYYILYSSLPLIYSPLSFPSHPFLIHSILIDTYLYLLIFFFPIFPSSPFRWKYSRIPYNHSFPFQSSSFTSSSSSIPNLSLTSSLFLYHPHHSILVDTYIYLTIFSSSVDSSSSSQPIFISVSILVSVGIHSLIFISVSILVPPSFPSPRTILTPHVLSVRCWCVFVWESCFEGLWCLSV